MLFNHVLSQQHLIYQQHLIIFNHNNNLTVFSVRGFTILYFTCNYTKIRED